MSAEQKEQLTKLRDEAQGAIQADDINKLREIVGHLEDAAAQAANFSQANAGNAQANPNNAEGHESADDVVDADFTDKKA